MNDWNESFDGQEFDNEDECGDDTSDTLPCPECGVEVYEDTERCPACGNYIVHSSSVWDGKPTWWILLGALGILAAVLMFLGL